jgi:hypothetical protein
MKIRQNKIEQQFFILNNGDLLEDGSWHFAGFQSLHHDLPTSSDELQAVPHQQCATYVEVEGHSCDVCYHPRSFQVVIPRDQQPNFQQPVTSAKVCRIQLSMLTISEPRSIRSSQVSSLK